ncbi:MAG: hemerythrin domain-containing protein [Cyclobacteriaceae bacterium]
MPIKRNEFLTPLSLEHHHGLLLCWKIRTGYRNNIEPSRIQSYAYWFYTNYLLAHFEVEEKYVFSILGDGHELVKRALMEHRKLRRLFEGVKLEGKNLGLIEEKLEAHIRFEERVLFNKIQDVASPSELEGMLLRHSDQLQMQHVEEWGDKFW